VTPFRFGEAVPNAAGKARMAPKCPEILARGAAGGFHVPFVGTAEPGADREEPDPAGNWRRPGIDN